MDAIRGLSAYEYDSNGYVSSSRAGVVLALPPHQAAEAVWLLLRLPSRLDMLGLGSLLD